MANDLRGQAELAIGSETVILRYDLGMLREAQVALSLSGGVEMFDAIARMDFNAIITLLWIGLKKDKPSLKFADVGAMDFSINDAMKALTEAITSALGKPKEGEQGKA